MSAFGSIPSIRKRSNYVPSPKLQDKMLDPPPQWRKCSLPQTPNSKGVISGIVGSAPMTPNSKCRISRSRSRMERNSSRSSTSFGYLYPSEETMKELYVNFVQDMNPEEVDFMPSLMFQVEQAHWHYEDNIVDQDPRLKSLSIKDFTFIFFKSCDPFKIYHANHVDDILDEFKAFKHSVPVAGSIILDQSYQRCLLVKGWKSNSWSFPRGKREDPDEKDHICAIRETMEEVGYDISPLLNINDLIEYSEEKKRVVLYIIRGVDEKYPFEPRTKKEVSEIAWHPLQIMGKKRNKYFMVGPFLHKLEKWIKRNHMTSSTTPLSEIGEICTIWKADKEQMNSTPRRFSVTPNVKINTPSPFQMGPSTPCRELQNSTPNSAQKRPSTPSWSKSNLNNCSQRRSSNHCWNSQTSSPYSNSSRYHYPKTEPITSPYPPRSSPYPPRSITSPYPPRSSPYPPRSSPYPPRSPDSSTYSSTSPYPKYRTPHHRRMEASDASSRLRW
ncbi:hypothetical protein SUGI_0423000 [Cryptomeria japonica]|uniref:mRNA-decapping enzyme subunit 2-like n=1 Tax=Cryptomeria japonica TaxID=3369 RepID=UPI002408D1F2|nr:mRNA-decapping enzyme subunit 2-like [Cryptomeria japonica]GLJ22464.1 hypothetical protein SUGI_0423000 [Cryptomeria japonica]